MTAQLLEMPTADAVRVRPGRTVRPSSARPSRRANGPVAPTLPAGHARACRVARPQAPASRRVPRPVGVPVGDGRYYWTPRAIAAMVLVVALTVGIMAATVVWAFLSVSNEPLEGHVAPAALVAEVLPGRH